MKALGKKIRLLRQQRSWNQEDMAKRLDISIPAFSKIETGITDPSLSRLVQVSNLFGLTVVELLTLSEDEKNQSSPRTSEVEMLANKVKEHEADIVQLQRKIIELYEEKENNRSV